MQVQIQPKLHSKNLLKRKDRGRGRKKRLEGKGKERKEENNTKKEAIGLSHTKWIHDSLTTAKNPCLQSSGSSLGLKARDSH